MKKLLFIFALPFLFTSCGSDRFDSNRLQNMKKPVIVIGVAKEVRDTRNNEIVTYGNIVLRDKDYNIESFRSNEFLDVLL